MELHYNVAFSQENLTTKTTLKVAISKSPSGLSSVSVNNAALQQQSGLQVNTLPAATVADLRGASLLCLQLITKVGLQLETC